MEEGGGGRWAACTHCFWRCWASCLDRSSSKSAPACVAPYTSTEQRARSRTPAAKQRFLNKSGLPSMNASSGSSTSAGRGASWRRCAGKLLPGCCMCWRTPCVKADSRCRAVGAPRPPLACARGALPSAAMLGSDTCSHDGTLLATLERAPCPQCSRRGRKSAAGASATDERTRETASCVGRMRR